MAADRWALDKQRELLELVRKNDLTDIEIGRMLPGVTTRAIRAWRYGANPTPPWAVDLIKYRLADKTWER